MNRLAIGFFTIFLFFIGYMHFFTSQKEESIINSIVQLKLYENSQKMEIENLLGDITVNTQFHNKIVVNGVQRPGFLHVYIIPDEAHIPGDPEITKILSYFGRGCAYIGYNSTIICSGKFLEDGFITRKDILSGLAASQDFDAAIKEHQTAFLTWVLAHELGHAVKNHKPAHFSEAAFHDEVVSASISHRQELEADEFAYKSIYSDDSRSLIVERLIIDIINSEIRRIIGPENLPYGVGIHYDYTGGQVMEYAARGTHPEFIIRATRLLLLAGERPGNGWIKEMAVEIASQMKKTQ